MLRVHPRKFSITGLIIQSRIDSIDDRSFLYPLSESYIPYLRNIDNDREYIEKSLLEISDELKKSISEKFLQSHYANHGENNPFIQENHIEAEKKQKQ